MCKSVRRKKNPTGFSRGIVNLGKDTSAGHIRYFDIDQIFQRLTLDTQGFQLFGSD